MINPTDNSGRFELESGQAAEQWQAEASKLGRFNLAVFGKTGVGKSTLINAIFGRDVADTGIGQPVTQEGHLYVHESGTLGLYDTKGLEIGSEADRLLDEVTSLIVDRRGNDPSQHIHAAYYCVRAGDHRFEPEEEKFIRGLHSLELPVLLVMTQVDKMGEQYRSDHLELAKYVEGLGLPVHTGRAYLTAAMPDPQMGFGKHGLEALLEATHEVVPEAVEAALAAAQVIDMKMKRRQARKRVAAAAAAATAVGATPVPFSDAAAIVPIQVGMMSGIAQVYQIPMKSSMQISIASTAVATGLGRAMVLGALKFVPGVNVVASGIAAAVAGSFTTAMGEAWIRTCEMMRDGKFGPLDDMKLDLIEAAFMGLFKSLFSVDIDRRKKGWESAAGNE